MVLHIRSGPSTFADFLELVQEDQKADLLDGVVYMSSPENIDHNRLVGWLDKVLGLYVEQRNLGELTINKVAYRLSTRNAPEPDLAFVRADRIGIFKSSYADGPPDVAIEFVSPDSVERDYEHKRRRYEEAGVGEYWIIDAEEKRATFLSHQSGGFVEMPVEDHVFCSRVIPGFRLDTRWLWQRPLPPTLEIVQNLLRT